MVACVWREGSGEARSWVGVSNHLAGNDQYTR